jgi:hypothetical protein
MINKLKKLTNHQLVVNHYDLAIEFLYTRTLNFFS